MQQTVLQSQGCNAHSSTQQDFDLEVTYDLPGGVLQTDVWLSVGGRAIDMLASQSANITLNVSQRVGYHNISTEHHFQLSLEVLELLFNKYMLSTFPFGFISGRGCSRGKFWVDLEKHKGYQQITISMIPKPAN